MIQMEVQLKLVQVQKMMYIDLERQLVYSATQCYTVLHSATQYNVETQIIR